MPLQLTTPIAPAYVRSLVVSICLQLFLITRGALAMDGGQFARCAILSLPAYWLMALLVMVRRRRNPTRGDLVAIRYGYLFVFAGIVIFTLL